MLSRVLLLLLIPLALASVSDFLDEVNVQMEAFEEQSATAWFAWATDITEGHEEAAVSIDVEIAKYKNQVVQDAVLFTSNGTVLSEDEARQLYLLKVLNTVPPMEDEDQNRRLLAMVAQLETLYSTATIAASPSNPDSRLSLAAIEREMATSRDIDRLQYLWEQWREESKDMRPIYIPFADLSNEAARGIGFKDTGDLWKSRFDLPPDEFVDQIHHLWNELKPLYTKLHCYARSRLTSFYDLPESDLKGGFIPAHLFGNMWAQDWGNIFDILVPFPEEPEIDVGPTLQEQDTSEIDMVKYGEAFFTSLGAHQLPHKFWERSMFAKPQGKDAVCHASAWDVARGDSEEEQDVRLKMCIEQTHEDLITIHHELGHIFYYLSYRPLKQLYRTGANSGFHEGIGDTMALSTTPEYLKTIGLLNEVTSNERTSLNFLMTKALDKLSFLPFGLLVDEWRWRVFDGSVTPENYNQFWWKLRKHYQGVAPPHGADRGDDYFDPGAKYHVASNTPYVRYFLATVLQFQFHRSLCHAAGHEGPLHECSIYQSSEAGELLLSMLEMGASKPWQEALYKICGVREMDAGAMIEFFAPLEEWIDEQIEGELCGWEEKESCSNCTPDAIDDDYWLGLYIIIGVAAVAVVLLIVGVALVYLDKRYNLLRRKVVRV